MSRRRTLTLTGFLSALALALPIWIQFDKHLIERRQMRARMAWEQGVRECEAAGGRWWRGDCQEMAP